MLDIWGFRWVSAPKWHAADVSQPDGALTSATLGADAPGPGFSKWVRLCGRHILQPRELTNDNYRGVIVASILNRHDAAVWTCRPNVLWVTSLYSYVPLQPWVGKGQGWQALPSFLPFRSWSKAPLVINVTSPILPFCPTRFGSGCDRLGNTARNEEPF